MVRQSPSRTSPHSSKRILLQTLCTALRARFRAPLRIRSRKDLRLNSQDSLWHFNTGQAMHASPMSYAVDRIQFVVIAAGSDVFRLLASPLNWPADRSEQADCSVHRNSGCSLKGHGEFIGLLVVLIVRAFAQLHTVPGHAFDFLAVHFHRPRRSQISELDG